MTTQEIVKSRIEMAILSAGISGILFGKGKIKSEEMDRQLVKAKQELYTFIASVEPKNESEVL